MEHADPSPTRRKVKFPPKASPRKRPPPIPKTEDSDDDEKAAETQYLLRRAAENLGKRGNKVEKKSSLQVAFGPGATSSTSTIRTYGVPKTGNAGKRNVPEPEPEPEVTDNEEFTLPLPMDVQEDGTIESLKGAKNAALKGVKNAATVTKNKKDYNEPWDYHHSFYPTTLPLRMPYAGDPELLDEAEFGQAVTSKEYDENAIIPAMDLGLLESSGEDTMYFFQFPACLPVSKQLATSKGKEKVELSGSLENTYASDFGDLKKLPGGLMGKLLIYKSGAIKLRLGDTLYDVSSGSDCSFAQHLVAINTEEGHCCDLGDVGKRAVVTPDISSLLNSVTESG